MERKEVERILLSHLWIKLGTSRTEGRIPTNCAFHSSCEQVPGILSSSHSLPPTSNVVAKKALISTHGAQNLTLFGVGGEG